MLNYIEILDLVVRKDEKALEILYGQYGRKFYAYCRQNWDFSEDEAWETVYRTFDTLLLKLSAYKFESQAHFDNFSLKVFINFLRQLYRSKKAKTEAEPAFVDLSDENEIPSDISVQLTKEAFNKFYNNERVENPALVDLELALAEMPEQEKDILLLRAQNYSYDEIAVFLNIDNNQLKVKHHRAKAKLINNLKAIQTKNN